MGPAVPPPPVDQPSVSPGPGDFNPYAPPQTQTSYLSPVDGGVIQPQVISFSDVFNTTWRLFFDNIGPFIGMGALVFGVNFLANIFSTIVNFATLAVEEDEALGLFAVFMFVLTLLLAAVNAWLQAGMLSYSIEFAKGMRPSFGRIFLPFNRFLGYLAVTVILGLIVFAGLVLLIVPGIILTIMFFCAPAVYLDGKAGVLDSFSISRTITRGNRWTILGLFLVSAVLSFLAIVVTCGLASLLVGPFFALLSGVIYTKCAGLFASARPPMAQMPPMTWTPPATPGMR